MSKDKQKHRREQESRREETRGGGTNTETRGKQQGQNLQQGRTDNVRSMQGGRQTQNLQQRGGGLTDLQVDEDRETHMWTVHPTRSTTETTNWLIECRSRNEAQALRNDLSNGRLQAPTESPQSYSSPRRHRDGRTMIYQKVA